MKKLLFALTLAAPLFAGAQVGSVNYRGSGVAGAGKALVSAEVTKPGGTSDTGALRVANKATFLYDSGYIAAGAVINGPILNTSGCSYIDVIGVNADGSATRVVRAKIYAPDGTTMLVDQALGTCPISSGACLNIVGPGAQSGGTTNVLAAVAITPPPFMSFYLVAGGASNGRVMVVCR